MNYKEVYYVVDFIAICQERAFLVKEKGAIVIIRATHGLSHNDSDGDNFKLSKEQKIGSQQPEF